MKNKFYLQTMGFVFQNVDNTFKNAENYTSVAHWECVHAARRFRNYDFKSVQKNPEP